MSRPLRTALLLGSMALVSCSDPAGPDNDSADTPAPQITGVTARISDRIPTVVHVSWTISDPSDTWIEYRGDDAVWRATPIAGSGAGVHERPLLGLHAEAEVTYRVIAEAGGQRAESPPATIVTGALPTGAPIALASPPTAQASGLPYLAVVTTQSGWDDMVLLVVDRAGEIVWYLPCETERFSMVLRTSHDETKLLFNDIWIAEAERSEVHWVDLDGEIRQSWPTPGMHHPFTDLPEGSVAWGAYVEGTGAEELREVDASGAATTLWSSDDWAAEVGEVSSDFNSNALWYEPSSDSFLLSSPQRNTVVEVDHESGATLRQFGAAAGSFAFDPPDSAFVRQHGVHYTQAGTLLLTSTASMEDGTFVREYTVDDESRTLHQVWSHGDGTGAWMMGEAHRLPNGNTLISYGSTPIVREVTADGDVAWQLDWTGTIDGGLARTFLVEDLYALHPSD